MTACHYRASWDLHCPKVPELRQRLLAGTARTLRERGKVLPSGAQVHNPGSLYRKSQVNVCGPGMPRLRPTVAHKKPGHGRVLANQLDDYRRLVGHGANVANPGEGIGMDSPADVESPTCPRCGVEMRLYRTDLVRFVPAVDFHLFKCSTCPLFAESETVRQPIWVQPSSDGFRFFSPAA
jgi:hypothetical protein